jgi:hypothetical protein
MCIEVSVCIQAHVSMLCVYIKVCVSVSPGVCVHMGMHTSSAMCYALSVPELCIMCDLEGKVRELRLSYYQNSFSQLLQ